MPHVAAVGVGVGQIADKAGQNPDKPSRARLYPQAYVPDTYTVAKTGKAKGQSTSVLGIDRGVRGARQARTRDHAASSSSHQRGTSTTTLSG